MTSQPQLLVKRLTDKARIPVKKSAQAAGYDLSSSREIIVGANGKEVVPTDLSVAIPEGYYGRIAPRSSLAVQYHIDVGAGVIDSDYRGPVGVVLFNHSVVDFHIAVGDRIAQLIIEPCLSPSVVEVSDLTTTLRGSDGFGSTGIH